MPARVKPAGPVHRHLHLQHRSHTGRLLHRRHTSYRGLALLLFIAGAFIIGLNILAKTTADAIVVDTSGGNSIHVYATVPAVVPQSSSTITQPVSGPIGKSAVLVRGVCPHTEPHVIVAIFMDGSEQGSSVCDDANTFSLPILIPLGNHVLVAKTYTITNDSAPDSAPVYLDYILLNTPAENTGSNKLPDTSPLPLTVAITEPFIVFGPGDDAVWTGQITGGTPPYYIRINWGDGSSDTFNSAGNASYRHHYKIMQPYDVAIIIRDAAGRQTTQHYAAVTPFRHPVINPALGTGGSNSPLSGTQTLSIYIIYLALLGLFGLAWKLRHREFAYAKAIARPRPFPLRYANYYGTRKRINRRVPRR